ncbi:AAA family ATPase [Winogradskyella sp. DF17]|uniref:AAA family ATPase n=1 Tax=Winogradskyella pelagia TaxID=2819984 RepID=A0ABS3T3R6_9FLAO|nr:AAA family ATPase [Winogradskyella sp. DF17]MBO3116516.1 AAA family ATPase [Winogradskyella sp. DF17]
MGQTLLQIAENLRDTNKKVQLIYAFNGTGKTRLSREFKKLISPKDLDSEEEYQSKVLYYNAFTEDLFYWDNDLDADVNRKIIIRPNGFTNWVLQNQGQEPNIITHFQYYTNDKLTPRFNQEYITKDKDNNDVTIKAFSEITFSLERGNEESIENLKISKGEESNLIWCIFYSLLELIVEVLNVPEPDERETNDFDHLEYIFIDDPVSSLDDTHLIELAVNIAELIKSSTSELKFIITTHNPLFYNVLFNEFNNAKPSTGYRRKDSVRKRFEKLDDGTYLLVNQTNDSPFSYHLYLLSELEKAIQLSDIQKYHFNFLRNILEKTSTFLGYNNWRELLPEESREAYYNRIINLSSHGKHSGEEVSVIEDNDKRVLSFLIGEIKRIYGFKSNVNSIESEVNATV